MITIEEQPDLNGIYAAYRPINFLISTDLVDDLPISVAYCDIYFNNVYYKTVSKTQPKSIDVDFAYFAFDIQDACQEYLKKYVPAYGEDDIFEATPIIASVLCKFRQGIKDVNGFIVSDVDEPVQGTGNTDPIDGEGEASDVFFAVNSTLQNNEDQDLGSHLDEFKSGTWEADSYPLTHRKKTSGIRTTDNDFFPILSVKIPRCLTLHYKYKGASYASVNYCAPCSPVVVPTITLPDANITTPYSYSVDLVGTLPIVLSSIVKPAWMTVSISGLTVTFSGTPGIDDDGEDIPVSFVATNECGSDSGATEVTVVGLVIGCIAGFISGTYTLPDAVTGVAYSYNIPIRGTAPFALGTVVKPAWMTIAIVGSNLVFSGTAGAITTDINISVEITNCVSDSFEFNDTIDITDGSSLNTLIENNTGGSLVIEDITPYFYLLSSGTPYPIAGGQSAGGLHGSYTGILHVVISGSGTGTLSCVLNGLTVATKSVTGAGTYNLGPVTILGSDNLTVKLD